MEQSAVAIRAKLALEKVDPSSQAPTSRWKYERLWWLSDDCDDWMTWIIELRIDRCTTHWLMIWWLMHQFNTWRSWRSRFDNRWWCCPWSINIDWWLMHQFNNELVQVCACCCHWSQCSWRACQGSCCSMRSIRRSRSTLWKPFAMLSRIIPSFRPVRLKKQPNLFIMSFAWVPPKRYPINFLFY